MGCQNLDILWNKINCFCALCENLCALCVNVFKREKRISRKEGKVARSSLRIIFAFSAKPLRSLRERFYK